jgi:PKHD-type hydroxylase|tara:strand:+ start:672 stop:1286 length:615 start_codon:yes stop_codon:yes gene_type:complete
MELECCYRVFNNILPKTFCDEVIDYVKQKHKLDRAITLIEQNNPTSKEAKAKSSSIRKSNIKFINPPWITNELKGVVAIANQEGNWNYQYSDNEDIQFTEYGKNQHYGFHCDQFSTPFEKGRLKGLIRKISMSVNLTDSSKYKGGEFLFRIPAGDGEYKTISPEGFKEKGSIVVFPSFVIHTVKPITKGKRNSLVMWTCGNSFI